MSVSTGLGLTEHPLRQTVVGEAQARPFEVLSAPLKLSRLALHNRDTHSGEEEAHVVELCRLLDVEQPPPDAKHFVIRGDGFRLRWERHTEFSTYTVFAPTTSERPFAGRAIDTVPADWIRGLPGELLVAAHVCLLEATAHNSELEQIERWFDSDALAGSRCAGGVATMWTDFAPADDGFVRFLVLDQGLRPAQAGRLVRRLLEIETYRLMALLGLPLARELAPEITEMENSLGDLTARTAAVSALDDERQLLASLSALSARVERTIGRINFRFGATEAYATLVRRRLAALREERIEGLSTIEEYMARRFAPAMDTCAYVGDRLERLSRRVSRAANLLRTRVDVALEGQNRNLLESMNRRAQLQLRLQETVEGLSVVILSYYSVSLIGYAVKGMRAGGFNLDVALVTALSIPVVLVAVATGVYTVRHRVKRSEPKDPG